MDPFEKEYNQEVTANLVEGWVEYLGTPTNEDNRAYKSRVADWLYGASIVLKLIGNEGLARRAYYTQREWRGC